jgi:hypothetical protein
MQTEYILEKRITHVPVDKQKETRNVALYVPEKGIGKICKFTEKNIDRFKLFSILDVIQQAQRLEKKFDYNDYVQVHWKLFRQVDAKNYPKYLKILIHDLQLIEPFISSNGKISYYNDEKNKGKNSLCKQYRFSKKYNFIKIMFIDHEKLVDYKRGKLTIQPGGKLDPYRLVWARTELDVTLDPYGIDEIPADLCGVYTKFMNALRYGTEIPEQSENSSRYYCKTVCMPNEFKKYLRYNRKDCLINYDIVGAYFSFLKEIVYHPPTQSQPNIPIPTYPSTLFTSDSYHIFGENLGLSREIIKHEFNLFLNAKKNYKKGHRFMKIMRENGLEKLADYILEKDEIWRELEAMETKILEDITSECIDLDISILRQHDGFLIPEENNKQIKKILTKVLKKYKFITFKESPLSSTVKEKVEPIDLDRFPTQHTASDLGWSIKILRNYNGELKDKSIYKTISSLVKLKKKLKKI